MPAKKGKKGKKGKGKGKKDAKLESKREKESDVEKAKANAALWEARCELTESSRAEYLENSCRLSRANERLSEQQHSAERSSIEIIAVLSNRDLLNEEKISALEDQIQLEKTRAAQEQETLVKESTRRITELEETFEKRCHEFSEIQQELEIVNDFRRRRPQMEQELQNVVLTPYTRETLESKDLEHKKALERMKQKFFINKVHLEMEAEQRVAVLAERAHNEAVVKLDEASRSMFKENIRLNEALGYHIKEVETSLKITNEFISKLTELRSAASELRLKVSSRQQALSSSVAAFEKEKLDLKQRLAVRTQASSVEQDRLQKLLSVRERALGRVKRTARSVLEQRSEMEVLFHEALSQVKQEILELRREAEFMHSQRMEEFLSGRRETINKTPHSNNTPAIDLREANQGLKTNKVSASHLSWEQRERVLRLLFTKINDLKAKRKEEESSTFTKTPKTCQTQASLSF
ncbi:hypothetical protein DNTS_032748 [Danionella cerebrum]|uniref:Basal body-orientation factor 1 n=1 Tax=Danionella cerebrum TaxID=2873325 RepID=A0A553NW24_9TELE|nr:hypothetical protein DNTS_032748 [Danionella translucida]